MPQTAWRNGHSAVSPRSGSVSERAAGLRARRPERPAGSANSALRHGSAPSNSRRSRAPCWSSNSPGNPSKAAHTKHAVRAPKAAPESASGVGPAGTRPFTLRAPIIPRLARVRRRPHPTAPVRLRPVTRAFDTPEVAGVRLGSVRDAEAAGSNPAFATRRSPGWAGESGRPPRRRDQHGRAVAVRVLSDRSDPRSVEARPISVRSE